MSLCLNAALVGYLLSLYHDGAVWPVRQEEVTSFPVVKELGEHLDLLNALSDAELITRLSDASVVVNGYSVQELALALLRAREFDLARCYQGVAFDWGQGKILFLPSSLSSVQVEAAVQFVQSSAVPFTARGIVGRICDDNRELYAKALFHTDEWVLFRQRFSLYPEEELLLLAEQLSGDGFMAALDKEPIELFQRVQVRALAEYLARYFPDEVIRLLEDDQVIALLGLLAPSSEGGVRVSMRLLQAQRKQVIWKASQAFLAKSFQKPELFALERDELLTWLKGLVEKKDAKKSASESVAVAPAMTVPVAPSARPASSKEPIVSHRIHVVKKGETLWTIAKRYGVHVEKIKYLNRLKGYEVKSGTKLRIPR